MQSLYANFGRLIFLKIGVFSFSLMICYPFDAQAQVPESTLPVYCQSSTLDNVKWDSEQVSLDSFEDRIIFLVDGSSGTSLRELLHSTDMYVETLFNDDRLLPWLGEHLSSAKIGVEQSFEIEGVRSKLAKASVFQYGLEKNKSQDWSKDYIHHYSSSSPERSSLLDLEHLLKRTIRKRKSLRYSYGAASASNPMLVKRLSECNTSASASSALFQSVYLVNISDSGSNSNPNLGLGDIIEIGIKNPEITGQAALYDQFRTFNKYYLQPELSLALFDARKKGYTEGIRGLTESRCEGVCQNSFNARLVQIKPALPPDVSEFFMLEQVPEFEFTSKGYKLNVELVKVDPQQTNYQLKSICMSPELTENFAEQWRCFSESDNWQFDWSLELDDEVETISKKPSRLQTKALFHYKPPNLDIGLIVEKQQSYNIKYQAAGTLKDGRTITRKLLAKHPSKTLGQVAEIENADIDRNRIRSRYLGNIAFAILAALTIWLLAWLYQYYRRRFKQPQLSLKVLTNNSEELVVDQDSGKPSELRRFHFNLDDSNDRPELLAGYIELENTAGTNKHGAWEEIPICSLGVELVAIKPNSISADVPLLLSGSDSIKDVTLRDSIKPPIIFDINQLQNLKRSDFPSSKLIITARAYVEVSSESRVNELPKDISFVLIIDIDPAFYQFETNLLAIERPTLANTDMSVIGEGKDYE